MILLEEWNKYLAGYHSENLICITIILILLGPYMLMMAFSLFIFTCAYATGIAFNIYRYFHKKSEEISADEYWYPPRLFLAKFWNGFGNFYYAHEIVDIDNFPTKGPAMVVYYHGAFNIDTYLILAKLVIHKKFMPATVGERFINKLPAISGLIDGVKLYTGNREEIINVLKSGEIVTIIPGGLREAFFSDENYTLVWGKRMGFAHVALQAKAPIIPMFTKNIRGAFFTPSFGKGFFRWIYEKTRLPLIPIFSGFPVKLTTYIGEPILYDPNISPEELASKVQESLKALIKNHQPLPDSIMRGVYERFRHIFKKSDKLC